MPNIPSRPKSKEVYEYADADGNRGIWITYVRCPNCNYDLDDDEQEDTCPDCDQLLDWDDLEEPEFD